MANTASQWFSFLGSYPDIKYLRLCWVDYSGVLRTRIVLTNYASDQLNRNKNGAVISVPNAIFDFPLLCPPIEGSTCVGELSVVPDFDSLRIHPHRENRSTQRKLETASVMCCLVPQDDSPALCPRTLFLEKLQALNVAGIEKLEVGFEIEFSIIRQHDLDRGLLTPIMLPHSYATSRLFQQPGSALSILEDMVENLQRAEIEVLHFHSESGPGTYEISTGQMDAVDAVDALIFSREVIQYVCAQSGYRATFLPKPIPALCKIGLGSHVHMSMEPSSLQWDFFGGILHRLPLICAIAYGNMLSYDRVQDGFWAGGKWAAWGRQNKETALRLINQENAHWEIKTMDGVGNVYLAMAAIFHASVEGINKGLKNILGDGCNDYPNKLSYDEKQKAGVTQKLPEDMTNALDILKRDLNLPEEESFCRSYGEHVVRHYMKIKAPECQLLQDIYGDPKTEDEKETAKLRQKTWVASNY